MKNLFPGYYRPTEKEFLSLWENCTFILDANVLLNLYRYSPETKDELINILQDFSERLWLPNQTAFEYHKNRAIVILSMENQYEKIFTKLEEEKTKIENDFQATSGEGRHPYLNDRLISGLIKAFDSLGLEIKNLQNNHPKLLENDPILEKVSQLFDGRVGNSFSEEQLKTIFQQGKERYEKSIPPGYKDIQKNEPDRYGDLIFWFQIMDYAKNSEKPIVLITDDRKEDWWLRISGRTIGPRPELIQEITIGSGKNFYMYSTDPFMGQAQKYLNRKINKEAIEEIRKIRKWDELQSLTNDALMTSDKLISSMKFVESELSAKNALGKAIELAQLNKLEKIEAKALEIYNSRANIYENLEILKAIENQLKKINELSNSNINLNNYYENLNKIPTIMESINKKNLPPG